MSDRPRPAYEKSVLINCPFDPDFRDLLLAIVFSVAAHGFVPRSARETEGTAEPRISRILQTLAGSKYSIHDLSRFSGEGADNLSRFNMPLELGMAAALRFERMGTTRPHNWLVLVPDGYLHQRFISDLAGFDPGKNTHSPSSVIREVSAWLRLQPDVIAPAPSALEIHTAFGDFCYTSEVFEQLLSQKNPGPICSWPLTAKFPGRRIVRPVRITVNRVLVSAADHLEQRPGRA